jgi:hypothetical protein
LKFTSGTGCNFFAHTLSSPTISNILAPTFRTYKGDGLPFTTPQAWISHTNKVWLHCPNHTGRIVNSLATVEKKKGRVTGTVWLTVVNRGLPSDNGGKIGVEEVEREVEIVTKWRF